MRPLFLIIAVAASAACQKAPGSTQAIDVVFAVESDPGVRLGGVGISVDGRASGETDSAGLLQTRVHGQPGQQLRVEPDCPEGHAAPSTAKHMRLRSFETLGELESRPLEITLRCRPEKRLAVFIVRTKNGGGLPVLLDGQHVARTNATGVAHFSTAAIAGTDFLIELDTRDHPRLRPQGPTHLMTLPDADEVFVIQQSFEQKGVPRRRISRRSKITKIE